MKKRSALGVLVFSLLLGLDSLSADPVVQRGIDVFTTPADGSTYYSFAQTPIPAGFFCKGSKPFTGRVAFKGLPLATKTAGQAFEGDTIVERLDDAVFNAKGTAETRIQFRALSLVSIAPIKTSCGAFHIYLSLGGSQRVTTMSIQRTQEGGGSFAAPLAVDARMTFIPVKPVRNKAARPLELAASVTFPALPLSWRFTDGGARAKKLTSVVVDTNGDLTPDTPFRGTSNFFLTSSDKYADYVSCCPVCHEDGGHQHCFQPYPCNEYCDIIH